MAASRSIREEGYNLLYKHTHTHEQPRFNTDPYFLCSFKKKKKKSNQKINSFPPSQFFDGLLAIVCVSDVCIFLGSFLALIFLFQRCVRLQYGVEEVEEEGVAWHTWHTLALKEGILGREATLTAQVAR